MAHRVRHNAVVAGDALATASSQRAARWAGGSTDTGDNYLSLGVSSFNPQPSGEDRPVLAPLPSVGFDNTSLISQA